MTNGLDTEAAAVRELIQSRSFGSGDALLGFATRFGQDRALRRRALMLKMDLADAKGGASNFLLEQMLGVVDDIERTFSIEAEREASQWILRDSVPETAKEGAGFDRSFSSAVEREASRRILLHSISGAKRPAVEPEVAFVCKNLGYTYRRGGFSLTGIDLKLRLGEITGVVGENANGKTTLFRLMAGELKQTDGTLAYPALGAATEVAIEWGAVKQQIAYVPQVLPKWYGSLHENLSYEAAIHGIRGAANRAEVSFIIERLGLAEHLSRSWSALSGGFRLRFALARALVWRPKLLILDEPLANLDFRAQLTVLRDLQDLATSVRDPIAVAMSSQHLYEVEAVADNILFLNAGKARYNGATADIGRDRDENVFELGTPLSTASLQVALRHLVGGSTVHHDGMAHIITTDLPITRELLLEHLLREKVPVEYFRDVSGSIKRLFDDDRDK